MQVNKEALCKKNLYPKNYVVLDFETTGLDLNNDEVIEIGAIKIRNGKYTGEKINMLCNPNKPINPEASKVNHITNEMLQDCPTTKEAITKLLKFIGDLPICGWNVTGFDAKFLKRYLIEYLNKPFTNKEYDSRIFAHQFFDNDLEYLAKYPDPKGNGANCHQVTVQKYYGIKNPCQHRAIGDVLACYEINKRFEKRWKEKTNSLKEIFNLMQKGRDLTKVMYLNKVVYISNNASELGSSLQSDQGGYFAKKNDRAIFAVDENGQIRMMLVSYKANEIKQLNQYYNGELQKGILDDLQRLGVPTDIQML